LINEELTVKISKIFLWGVVVPVFVLAALTVRQITAISMSTRGVSYDQTPFKRPLPESELKFLFLGDSTSVGIGADNNRLTTAGYFAMDFPQAEVINMGRSGQKIRELLVSFDDQNLGMYDLAVIQIGGNDILKFTPVKNIERDMQTLIGKAKTISRHVVILHSGNVGAAPIFRWPFDIIMTERSRRVRDIYMGLAKANGVYYVDLFQERGSDLFLKDVPKYYAPDLLHPSADGYRWWYERIRQTLDEAGVVLN
jgi:lysophospholipase L1-like esterase